MLLLVQAELVDPTLPLIRREGSMRMTRRRRTTEVAQWALADVDLKPFIYVYELPPEYNVAFNGLPAGWHSEQYDCELPR